MVFWNSTMRAPGRLRRRVLFALAIGGLAFPVHPAAFPPDPPGWDRPTHLDPSPLLPVAVLETVYRGHPYPDLDCDPDILILRRFCPDCVTNRLPGHCPAQH